MDAKNAFVLIIGLMLVLGCCVDADNIFDHKREEIIVLPKLVKLLSQNNPGASEVHHLLSISKDKSALIEGVAIRELLDLAEINPDYPLKNCHRRYFDSLSGVCETVSKNFQLFEYCEYCYDLQYNHCSQFEKARIFNGIFKNLEKANKLLLHSRGISRYIVEEGDENANPWKSVSDYLEKLKFRERRAFREACMELEETIKEELSFFEDENGKKTFEYLKEFEPEKYLMRERCDIVMKLVPPSNRP